MGISSKVERIIHEVEALSHEERVELLHLLEDSSDADSGWRIEIQRRAREIDEGKVQLIEEEDFLSKLRQ